MAISVSFAFRSAGATADMEAALQEVWEDLLIYVLRALHDLRDRTRSHVALLFHHTFVVGLSYGFSKRL